MQRFYLFCAMLLLVGCSATWAKVVRYSAEPAEAPALVEVYKAVLADVAGTPRRDSIAIQEAPGDQTGLAYVSGSAAVRVPGHWADTLQREVRAALTDPARDGPADSTTLRQAARALKIVLLPSDTSAWPLPSSHLPPARATLSQPGFNADSTIAAMRVDYWCGPLCGSGRTLLLARRPGTKWRVWHAVTHWIS
jgi:hypothetical protein